MQKWQNAKLAQADKVHFTRAGYQLMGDLFYEALNRELKKDWHPQTFKRSNVSNAEKETLKSESNSKDKPLPRGLRRKPAPHPPATKTNNTTTKKIDSDRFPYIPD